MKALVYKEYGTPDVLHLAEVDKPVPKDDEVLIRVHAASINDWDWGLLRGVPFFNRMDSGLRKPKRIQILGSDISGRVEAVGKNVTKFKSGDEIFGDLCECGWGGFAEYVCAKEKALTLKPVSMSFEQAAAIPQAGVLAMQGLLQGKIESGQKILINGASGGAGSFAVQIAKSLGAHVTGVCRTGKEEFVRSLGADEIIDFEKEDFTKSDQRFDLVLDQMAFHSVFDTRRILKPTGRYIAEGGAMGIIMQIVFIGLLISLFSKKKMGLLMLRPNKDMDKLVELFEAGKFVPAIDKCFTLSKGADAFRLFGQGKKGKVVFTMEEYL